MYKRDFLERLVEEGAKVLATILGLVKDGRLERAIVVVDESVETYTGYTFEQVDNVTDDTFLNFLEDSKLSPQHLELLMLLLVERAKLEQLKESPDLGDVKSLLNKALCCIDYLNKLQANTFSLARAQKQQEIKALLK